MEATQASWGRFYRPELDVVRFLAFFLVFLVHTLPSTRDPRVAHLLGGFGPAFDAIGDACGFGLSLFFALSAFLICELLLRERDASGTIAVKQFYIRRILRIWPLYYLGLALGVVFALLPGGQPAAIVDMGWFVIFMGSWYCVFHGALLNPANVLWSVSVEEQFYLFAPWLIKYLNRKSLYGFCLTIILIANLCLFYLGRVRAPHASVWCNTFVQFECFAGGILLCLVLHGRLPRLVIWQRLALLAGCLFCWFYACYGLHAFFGGYGGQNPGSWPLIFGWALAALGCIMLLTAFLGVSPKLLPGWAIYLGRISFGLYVYHLFAVDLMNRLIIQEVVSLDNPVVNSFKGLIFILNFVFTLALTILMAALSYRYFETPFLKMKKRHAIIDSQPIAGAD
ncbi:MAG: acyltransferase [Terracidiphilus sp.]|jgi:peptidoglycan/LPS O-acetylase OafA/YrhL